jgi:hypothetical protein
MNLRNGAKAVSGISFKKLETQKTHRGAQNLGISLPRLVQEQSEIQ